MPIDVTSPPTVLVLAGVPDALMARVAERYAIIDARADGVLAVDPDLLRTVRGIVCTGRAKLGEAEISALPMLAVVSSYSAGLDHIDVNALHVRGIRLHNTSLALADAVADLAFALMLGVMRRIAEADRFVRAGRWKDEAFPFGTGLVGRKVGILGFGPIGMAIARRCHGFNLDVAYCARSPKAERQERFFATPGLLAAWSDVLIVACSATPETHGMVDRAVLAQLGAGGFLVNVARGSIVEEKELIAALKHGTIAGAALDVFAQKPTVPEAILAMDNVILTPHMGSATGEARAAMAQSALDAIDAHFEGRRPD